jgi:cadherin 22
MKVTAWDADDPTYGSSARVVYSVLDGESFFTVDRQTGKGRLLA